MPDMRGCGVDHNLDNLLVGSTGGDHSADRSGPKVMDGTGLGLGHFEVAERLLRAGANVNGRVGEVPLLDYFQERKMDEAVDWLKKNGATIRP